MTATTERRRHLIASALAFVVALCAYVPMIPAGVSIGDAAEAQTVPYILGIAHPTGFPAFTLAGWIFSHVVPAGTVAWRLNAFTAGCTAASAAVVVAIAVTIGAGEVTAVFAALVFAFGTTVWSGALVANAQILAGPLSLLAMLACLRFARDGAHRWLVVACASCGFGIAAHPSAIWIIPAIVVAAIAQRGRLSLRTCVIAVAALALPLTLYAYLPLRSAVVAAQGLDPTAGQPLALGGGIDWDTNTPRTLDGFLDEVLGRQEGASGSIVDAFDPTSWVAAAKLWYRLADAQYGPLVLLLALAGCVSLALRDRRALSVLAAGTVGGILFAHAYETDTHLDRYVFFSFAIVAVLAAAATRSAALGLGRVRLQHLIALVLALVAARTYAINRTRVVPAWSSDGAAIVAAVRRDTPDDAIVVAQWNDAAALAYGAFVEGTLGSRIIVSGWPDTYAVRYQDWARTRPVVLYVSPLGFMRGMPLPRRLSMRERPSSLRPYRIIEIRPR